MRRFEIETYYTSMVGAANQGNSVTLASTNAPQPKITSLRSIPTRLIFLLEYGVSLMRQSPSVGRRR
jgi:hypothetical protein